MLSSPLRSHQISCSREAALAESPSLASRCGARSGRTPAQVERTSASVSRAAGEAALAGASRARTAPGSARAAAGPGGGDVGLGEPRGGEDGVGGVQQVADVLGLGADVAGGAVVVGVR